MAGLDPAIRVPILPAMKLRALGLMPSNCGGDGVPIAARPRRRGHRV